MGWKCAYSHYFLYKFLARYNFSLYLCSAFMTYKAMKSKYEALRYVMDHQAGEMIELEKAIGKDRVEEFEYLGYIRNGMSQCSDTYQSTATFLNDYNSFYRRSGVLAWIPSMIFGLMAKLFS